MSHLKRSSNEIIVGGYYRRDAEGGQYNRLA